MYFSSRNGRGESSDSAFIPNIYRALSEIDNFSKFDYILIVIFVISIIRIMNPAPLTVFAVIVGIIVVAFLHSKRVFTDNNFYVATMHKLDRIRDIAGEHHVEYFYLDSELIDFTYQTKEYLHYNPTEYRKMIKSINIYLRLTKMIQDGNEGMGELYDLLLNRKHEIMNIFHSFVHSISRHPKILNKHQQLSRDLERLLNYHLTASLSRCKEKYGKRGINNKTRFIYKNHPMPQDTNVEPNYQFY